MLPDIVRRQELSLACHTEPWNEASARRQPAAFDAVFRPVTAIIRFPAVDELGTIFDVAISRAEEITLGILCASLVSWLVLPRSVAILKLSLWSSRGLREAMLSPTND